MNHVAKQRIVAVIVMAGLALPASGCTGTGGSPVAAGASPPARGASGSPSAVAYSACIRSHGVPNFPDPASDGKVPKGDAQQFGVSTARLRAAQQACQSLLPADGSLDQQAERCISGGDCPPAVVQQILAAQRRFAQCMRSHGVPTYPDPIVDSQGRPIFVFNVSSEGFDPHEARIMSKEDECQRVAPAPEPRQVNP